MKHIDIIISLCIILFTLTCQKEEVDTYIDYQEYRGLIGPEGGTIHFFGGIGRISNSLFPAMEISPNTFLDSTKIQIHYSKIYYGNIPPEITSISENNVLWRFSCEEIPLNPIKIILPFSDPDDYLILDNYKYLFKPYKILYGRDTKYLSNWEAVEDFKLDTMNNMFTFSIENLDYAYAVFFNEIKQDDVCYSMLYGSDSFHCRIEVIEYEKNYSVEFEKGFFESINDIWELFPQGQITEYIYYYNDYWRFYENKLVILEKGSNYLGCFAYKNGTSYYNYNFNSKDVNYSIEFSFKGNTSGLYSGENIYVKYNYTQYFSRYDIDTYTLFNTNNTTILITKYGDIGEYVEGNIKGPLYTEDLPFDLHFQRSGNEVEIDMKFLFKRAR